MADYLRCRPDASPAAVAHHLLESLPAGDAGLAARWAERAAADAMAHLAWEDAAGFYDRALRAAAGHGAADRCRLLRGLGVAQLRSSALAAATSTLREAADTARAAGDPVLIGEVALAMEGFHRPGLGHHRQAAVRRGTGPPARRRQPAAGTAARAAGRRGQLQLGTGGRGRCPGRLWQWPNVSPTRKRCARRCGHGRWPRWPGRRAGPARAGGPDARARRRRQRRRRGAVRAGSGGWTRSPSSAASASRRRAHAAGAHRGAAAVTHRELASAVQPSRAGLRPRAVRPGPAPDRGIRPDRGPRAQEHARPGGRMCWPGSTRSPDTTKGWTLSWTTGRHGSEWRPAAGGT